MTEARDRGLDRRRTGERASPRKRARRSGPGVRGAQPECEEAARSVLAYPQCIGTADDRDHGQRIEITTVEGRLGLRVDEEDFAVADTAALPPDGKHTPLRVAFECETHCDAIDYDGARAASDDLSGKR